MNLYNSIHFASYWGQKEIIVNLLIVCNLLGAMLCGMLLGYERIYQGRAAGMRTYSLVCLASCALTVFNGYAPYWFGGQAGVVSTDPTRVIQGIVTGVGFLGAGVIMKEGMTITGLSTAASIWLCAAIGVLIGVGFYAAALSLTLLAIFSMLIVSKIEDHLPHKKILAITVKFKKEYIPIESIIREATHKRGYRVVPNSMSIVTVQGQQEWHYTVHAQPGKVAASLTDMSNELVKFEGVDSFTLTPVRH